MSKKLVFNRSVWLTALLLLLSTGTYTYSESNPAPLSIYQSRYHYPKSLTLSTEKNGIKAIVPIEYYWATMPQPLRVKEILPPEYIMGVGLTGIGRLETFLLHNNQLVKRMEAHELAGLYWEESMREGVNPDVAFTQMCLETGFLRFDGTVDPAQHNYCGLGVTGNGVKGLKFSTPREGVRAHIQHLKAYASTEELKGDLVDHRFHFVKRGSAEEISDLTGKWAADRQYDKKIRNLLLRLYQVN